MPKRDHDPKAALESHAKKRDTIAFSEPVLHGRLRFGKGEVVRFHDPAVAAYFDIAFNGTELTDKEPTREIGPDLIDLDPDNEHTETVDPHTRIGNGRDGVGAGTTVHQVATGNPMASHGDAPLGVHDVNGASEA